jgi:hypothetical protein
LSSAFDLNDSGFLNGGQENFVDPFVFLLNVQLFTQKAKADPNPTLV